MKYRVDTRGGYAYFADSDKEKAWKMYKDQGFRIRLCQDFGDEGVVLEGVPLDVDVSPRRKRELV